MSSDKIYIDTISGTLDVKKQPEYLYDESVLSGISNSLTKLTKTVNVGATNALKLYGDMENIRSLLEVSSFDGVDKVLSSMIELNKSLYFKEMYKLCESILNIHRPIEQNAFVTETTSGNLIEVDNIIHSSSNRVWQSIELLHLYSDDIPEEEVDEVKVVNTKVLENIFCTEKLSNDKKGDSIIVLSPVNDRVLKYLSENPQAILNLSSDDFEIVMAELYRKLGYHVERTQSTRDGGKDIIISKPDALGDFIYYVECKRYAVDRPVGVGIVRSLSGVVSADRVNGGILATTSYFTKDARKFVSEHNLEYQIKMQDYTYKVQIPRITPHVCRHTFCSRMAAARMNPKTLQYIMGHADISVTMNVYTHLGFEDASEEVSRISKEKSQKAIRKVV